MKSAGPGSHLCQHCVMPATPFCILPFGVPVHDGNSHIVECLFAAIKKLVDSGENVNEVEAAGNTPLHSAAYEGWLEGVELLLGLGAKIDASNNAGDRPYHWAENMGHKEVMEFIVEVCRPQMVLALVSVGSSHIRDTDRSHFKHQIVKMYYEGQSAMGQVMDESE